MTTQYKSLLKVGYFDHKGNERLPEITSAEPFKYCYFRHVHNGKDICAAVMDTLLPDGNIEMDVLEEEDERFFKVSHTDCNVLKYIIDEEVKDYDEQCSPSPPYRP